MSSKPSSLEAAARDVIDRDGPPEGVMGRDVSPAQLDAFRDDEGRLPENVFQLVRQSEGEGERGPGRPKGSRNKRSEELAKLIAHKYGDPVEFQAGIYALPLDQLTELLLVADGTIQRRGQLEELLVGLAERVERLAMPGGAKALDGEDYRNLTKACDALANAASKMQGKPGDLAVKALNLQLAAARTVSEYVHSKKPVEAKIEFENLPTIVMPGGMAGVVDFSRSEQAVQFAGDMLAKALGQGRIEAADIVGLEFRDGQFLLDGETVEMGADDGE